MKLLLWPYLLIYAAPLRPFFLLNSGVEISLEDYTCFISPFLFVQPTSFAPFPAFSIDQLGNKKIAHSNTKGHSIPNRIDEDGLIDLLLYKCGLHCNSMALRAAERDGK